MRAIICLKMSMALSCVLAVSVTCLGETLTDDEVRQDVQKFLTTYYCGNYGIPVLTKEVRFGGDTNRLARILAECAQTNDERVVESALEQLVKYGTFEQLPFLYSCVTNSNIGDKAIKSILRIEGITHRKRVGLFCRRSTVYDSSACGSLLLHDLHVLHGFFSSSPLLHGSPAFRVIQTMRKVWRDALLLFLLWLTAGSGFAPRIAPARPLATLLRKAPRVARRAT